MKDNLREEIFKQLLQKNVSIRIENKVIKNGLLILYKQNDYCIDLLFKKENLKKNLVGLQIPIPFNITNKSNGYVFDYKLYKMSSNDNILKLIKNIKPEKNNKLSLFYDKYVYIDIEE